MTLKSNISSVKRGKGFKRTASILQSRIKSVGSTRGFAVTRLLTHWPDVVGAEIARAARPVDVKYGKGGFGATLTLLVKGAEAPMIEMQKERIREIVNACYGYNAIHKIRITQTAVSGFSDPADVGKPDNRAPSAQALAEASDTASDIQDTELRYALQRLGAQILTQNEHR